MPIKVTCPKCQGVLHAPDDAGGKRGKCPTCGTVLAIPAAGSAVVPPAAPAAGASAAVPVGGGRPLGDAPGYGLLPPSGGEVRQSSVPMLPRPGDPVPKAARPAAGFGSPPAVKPGKAGAGFGPPAGDLAAEEVRGYRRARRGLGLAQTGQFFLLLAGLAGPGLAIARHYGVALPDKDPGFLGQAGLSSVTEIVYAAVVIPFALGLLLLVLGRVGFGNLPRSSFARGPAKLGGLFALLAVMGLVTAGAMSGKQVMDGFKPVAWSEGGTPSLRLLPMDELPGKLQLGGLFAFGAFGLLAEAFFVGAVGRLAAGLRHETAAARHTRFLLWAHLGLVLVGGWFALRAVLKGIEADHFAPLWGPIWESVGGTWDDLLGKTGAARPAVILGLMMVPSLIVWCLYARLTGGGRRAVGDWLAAHDPAG